MLNTLPDEAVAASLSGIIEIVELPLGDVVGRLDLAGTTPILYLDTTSPPAERLDVLLDVLRILTFGDSAAHGARRVRHLRPVA